MIEEDSSVDPRSVAHEDGHFEQALLYDFAKFLTTMALLMLGGVLTVTQTADKAIAKPPVVAMVMGFIAIAGVCAISAAGKLAKVNVGRDHPKFTPRNTLVAAIAFLGMGAGGFLTIWWKTL
jgi:hypothetical protein